MPDVLPVFGTEFGIRFKILFEIHRQRQQAIVLFDNNNSGAEVLVGVFYHILKIKSQN